MSQWMDHRNTTLTFGVQKIMRGLCLAALLVLVSVPLPAPLIPQPNLAKRIESADTIVVARVVSGTTQATGDHAASDVVLRIDRVLKGDAIIGGSVAARLEGRGHFAVPNATQTIAEPLYGIWFLSSVPHPHTIVSRDGNFGELHFAPVILPEHAPPGKAGGGPAASVANEIAASLRWMAETQTSQLNPRAADTGTPDVRRLAALSLSQFRTLSEDFRTLAASDTRSLYREFASAEQAPLRAVGIQGLITVDDPEGVKQAAADWTELVASADVNPIITSLMAFSNDRDPDAVRALGVLALRDPGEPGLRQNAIYALRSIHTKQALPALVALLDDKDERVRPYAISGLCLFVRNAPTVTPQSVPSMAWLQTRQPAPFLTADTEPYCPVGGAMPRSANLDSYAGFWKGWWQQHHVELGQ